MNDISITKKIDMLKLLRKYEYINKNSNAVLFYDLKFSVRKLLEQVFFIGL